MQVMYIVAGMYTGMLVGVCVGVFGSSITNSIS